MSRCRACAAGCAQIGVEDANIPPHLCLNRSGLMQSFKDKGVNPEALCLPDAGRGRLRWEASGLQWADPNRSVFGVRCPSALSNMQESNHDPLGQADVIVLSKQ